LGLIPTFSSHAVGAGLPTLYIASDLVYRTLARVSEAEAALVETTPPRNGQLKLIEADEPWGGSSAPGVFPLRHRIDRFAMSQKTHETVVRDGAKALRAAICKVFGPQHPVQRCRNHKIRNVVDGLPEEQKDQMKAAMRASYKLQAKEGMARLRKLADWL
jgi:hypothetical protein